MHVEIAGVDTREVIEAESGVSIFILRTVPHPSIRHNSLGAPYLNLQTQDRPAPYLGIAPICRSRLTLSN